MCAVTSFPPTLTPLVHCPDAVTVSCGTVLTPALTMFPHEVWKMSRITSYKVLSHILGNLSSASFPASVSSILRPSLLLYRVLTVCRRSNSAGSFARRTFGKLRRNRIFRIVTWGLRDVKRESSANWTENELHHRRRGFGAKIKMHVVLSKQLDNSFSRSSSDSLDGVHWSA